MAQLGKRRNERQDQSKPTISTESINSSPAKQSMASKRLQPNEPLHMTTRAASLASSVAAGTTAPSATSNGSRRSSLGETTKSVGGDDLDSDRPAKLAKISSAQDSIAVSQQSTPPQDSNITSRTRASAISVNQHSTDHTKTDDEAMDDGASDGQASQLWDDENLDDAEEESPEDSYPPQELPKSNHNLRVLRGTGLDHPARNGRPNGQNQEQNAQINDRQSVEAEESGGILKRMPGRRRAPHPDTSIEVDLRRQLELKVAYRAVVKALKPILMELGERTRNEIQAKEDAHKQFDEYEEVIAELDERLNDRKRLLEAELQAEQARLERDFEASKTLANEKFDFFLRDRREDYLLRCKDKCLNILDDAEKEYDSDATDYEDGVVPKIYHIDNDGSRKVLADENDSRSRYFVETARKWDDTVARCDFRQQQLEFDPTSFVSKPKGFATYDPKQRALSQAYFDVLQLADAAEHVETESVKATKKAQNKAATGLHALVDAISMASPMSHDVKPNVHDLRTPKTLYTGTNVSTADSKHNSAASSAKERSSRRQRHLSKPQPLFGSGPEPYTPSGHQQQDSSRQYAPGPPLPPTAHARVPPAPPNAPAGYESGQSAPTWQHSAGLLESRREGYASAHNDPKDFETDRVAPVSRTSTNDDVSRQAPRRRPGPRAFFANEDPSQTPQHGTAQPTWEPFTNTMGPPTYLPPYVKPAETGRGNASPTESPISPVMSGPTPTRSGADWPGFSTSSTAGHGRVGGIDRPMIHGSFPLSGPPSATAAPGRPPLSMEQLAGWRGPNSPEPRRSEEQSPRNRESGLQQSYYQSPQAHSGYPPSSQYYSPYKPYPQTSGAPERQAYAPSNSTNLPPLLPHPLHLNHPPYQATSQSPPQLPSISATQADPPQEQGYRQTYQTHSRNPSQPQASPHPQSPYARTQNYPPHGHAANPGSTQHQPHLAQSQAQAPNQHYPNNSGHQRILPATLDPTRHSGSGSQNPSPSMRPVNVPGTPTEADKHAPAHTQAPAGGMPSRHSSPRMNAASPPTGTQPTSANTTNAPGYPQQYGFLPPFSSTSHSYRPPQRHTPTSTPMANTPGRTLQPTPPQAQQQPPKPDQSGTPSAPPSIGQQYGSSPYAAIAPAPPGPAAAGSPASQGQPLAPAPPMGSPMPPASSHSHGHAPGPTGEMYPGRPYDQPNPDSESPARRDGQRSDKDKNARGPREKEWKFTSSRWG